MRKQKVEWQESLLKSSFWLVRPVLSIIFKILCPFRWVWDKEKWRTDTGQVQSLLGRSLSVLLADWVTHYQVNDWLQSGDRLHQKWHEITTVSHQEVLKIGNKTGVSNVSEDQLLKGIKNIPTEQEFRCVSDAKYLYHTVNISILE